MTHTPGNITSFSKTYNSSSGPRRMLQVQLRPGAAGGSVGLLRLELPNSVYETDDDRDRAWLMALLDLTQGMADLAAQVRAELKAARLEAELAELRKQGDCWSTSGGVLRRTSQT